MKTTQRLTFSSYSELFVDTRQF